MADNQITEAIVLGKIYVIRGQKVIWDEDLAELYEVQDPAAEPASQAKSGAVPWGFYVRVESLRALNMH